MESTPGTTRPAPAGPKLKRELANPRNPVPPGLPRRDARLYSRLHFGALALNMPLAGSLPFPLLPAVGLILLVWLGVWLILRWNRSRAERLVARLSGANAELRKEIERVRRIEKSMRQNDAYIRAVVNSVMEGIVTFSESGLIDTLNPAAEKMFGYRHNDVLGESFRIFFPENFRGLFDRQLERYRRTGRSGFIDRSRELTGRRQDGTTFPLELSVSEMHLDDYRTLVAIMTDITRHKRLEEELRRLSSQDGLTGIANRRTFDSTLVTEWKRATRHALVLSLVMIDIDFFKNYNDTFGHQAGDEVLKKVAATLKSACKRPGDFPARYGGEEFVVLLPETAPNGVAKYAERLRAAVESLEIPHPKSAAGKYVTVSLGVVSLVPQRKGRPDQLVAAADAALYRAKGGGRNRAETHSLPDKPA